MKKSDDDAEKKNEGGDSYEVGYGKPPKDTRFKKGQSGNSKGRPKGRQNMDTMILREAAAPVVINTNGKSQKVPMIQAITKRLFNKAVAGEPRAMDQAIERTKQAQERIEQGKLCQTDLEDIDKLVIENLKQRFQAAAQGEKNDDSEPEQK